MRVAEDDRGEKEAVSRNEFAEYITRPWKRASPNPDAIGI
jgi:hypothetical protein